MAASCNGLRIEEEKEVELIDEESDAMVNMSLDDDLASALNVTLNAALLVRTRRRG